MISKILITNNTDGNHSPDVWAMAAAETIADISGLVGDNAIDGQRLLVKFADVLVKHFDEVQTTEQDKLAADPKHVLTHVPHHLPVDLKAVASELQVAAKGTGWEKHYMQPEVRGAVMVELAHLFHTSMHVDRLSHVAKNPDCEHAQA